MTNENTSVEFEKKVPWRPWIILGVSAGQWYHERKFFEPLLNQAVATAVTLGEQNDGKTPKIVISLYDKVQKYNFLMSGEAPDEITAEQMAQSVGLSWYASVQSLLEQDHIGPHYYGTLDWDYWSSHPTYEGYRSEFEKVYGADPFFANLIDATAENFCLRNIRKIVVGKERAIQYSRMFQLDEAAAETVGAEEFDHVELYPADVNTAFRAVSRGQVPLAPQGLTKRKRIRVKIKDGGETVYEIPKYTLGETLRIINRVSSQDEEMRHLLGVLDQAQPGSPSKPGGRVPVGTLKEITP